MSYLTVLKHKYKWPNQSGFISALKQEAHLYTLPILTPTVSAS